MKDFIPALKNALGSAVSTDDGIRRSYDHDLAEMPSLLLRLYDRVPSAVVLPTTTSQVEKALSIAWQFGVPVTPRGQGTSGYGGSMPCSGGLLVDLGRMDRILSVDAGACTADVEPGVRWADLDAALAGHGLTVTTCPTSSPSSTVGGWFSMGGTGIGGLEYGEFRNSVLEIDVTCPNGIAMTCRGADMDSFYGTCGMLGIVTRLRIRVRKKDGLVHMAFAFDDLSLLEGFLPGLRGAYSASILSAGYARMQAEVQGLVPPICRGFMLCLTCHAHAGTDQVLQEAERAGFRPLPGETALHEWNCRFLPMRLKRMGPSLNAGETVIPLHALADFWNALSRSMVRDRFGMEAFAVRGGRAAVLVYVPDSPHDLLALPRMGKAMLPVHLGTSLGGEIYSPGLWFTCRSRKFYGEQRYARILHDKRNLDPKGIMNPGKITGNKFVSTLLWFGSRAAAPFMRLLGTKPTPIPAGKEESNA